MRLKAQTARQWRPLLWGLLVLPALWLMGQVLLWPEQLGADPAKSMVDQTGQWALWMLLLALSVTPLRMVTGQAALLVYRRATGLAAAAYAVLHGLAYAVLLLQLDWARLGQELTQRPYIVVGAAALMLYLPLVLTSTQAAQRRLGRRWVMLHRLVYAIAVLALVHLTWLKKVGLYDSWPYVLAFVVLMAIRLWTRLKAGAATVS